MRKTFQTLSVSLRNLLGILCCISIILSFSQAIATESHHRSPLSLFGFTNEQFAQKVKAYIDIPYKAGGSTKKGMDCSGFSKTVYSKFFGIDLPRRSVDQFSYSELKKIDAKKLQPGDLIFFSNRKKKRVNHVGIYLSNRNFIHASSSQGIMISSLDDSYWKIRFMGSKRHAALDSSPKNTIVHITSLHQKTYR